MTMTLVVQTLTHVLAVAPSSTLTPTNTGVGGAVGGVLPKPPYDVILAWILQLLIFLTNLVGGMVVGVATVRGLLIYLVDLILRRGGEVPKEAIRLSLGRSLSLALEFQLGADILGTALNPSLRDIASGVDRSTAHRAQLFPGPRTRGGGAPRAPHRG